MHMTWLKIVPSHIYVGQCTETYDLISCCNEVYVLTLLIDGVLSHTDDWNKAYELNDAYDLMT